jgi:hypothetical protein
MVVALAIARKGGPDMTTKLTVFFEATGGTAPTGWTETFYCPLTDLDLTIKLGKDYAKVRKALLGVGASMKFIRAADIPPDRTTVVYYLVGKEGEPDLFTTSPADDHDPTQVDLLVRMDSTPKGRRQFALSGLPDSVTDQLLLTGVNGAFTASPAFKQWSNFIQTRNLQIRVRTAVGPPPVYSYNTINRLTPIMIRNRKRGRPFELFRGRRIA